jgi:trehalose 6-phosphate synthase
LDTALTMPLAERIARHSAMLAVVKDNDIHRWQERFIADLKRIEARNEESHLQRKVATFPKLA